MAGAVLFLVVFIGVTVLSINTQMTLSRVEKELNDRNRTIDTLRQSLFLLASDYNALRVSLGLQPQDISLLLAELQDGTEQTQESVFEQGIEALHGRYLDELYGKKIDEIRSTPAFSAFLADSGFIYEDMGGLAGVLKNGTNVIYRITFFPDDESISIRTAMDAGNYDGKCDDRLIAFSHEMQQKLQKIVNEQEQQKYRIRSLKQNDIIISLLAAKQAEFDLTSETESRISGELRKNGRTVSVVCYDKFENAFYLDNEKVSDFTEFKNRFVKTVEQIDTRPTSEHELDTVVFALENGFKNEKLNVLLKETNLSLRTEPREDETYIYYDVFAGQERIGAFAIEKKSASIILVDKNNITIRPLQTFSGTDISAIRKPNGKISFPSDTFAPENEHMVHFLLFGMNEDLSDTIILVSGDTKQNTISLLSIPRDLFYNSQRINWLPRRGMEECVKTISGMTGIPVTKYAAVDMYAFIDVIDILGGVDVYLDEPVVDPTYKIREHGEWKTLAYPVGNHHFNGIQAMRIIRSRATTSDFQRAYRQQLVLEALVETFKKRSRDDQGIALDLFTAMLKYVDTNMSLVDLVQYFILFKDSTINSRQVLSTHNILYASYSNLYLLNETQQQTLMETLAEEQRGAFILLPKNQDWLFFKLYVQQLVYKNH